VPSDGGAGVSNDQERWKREDTLWWLAISGSWLLPTTVRGLLQGIYGYSNPVLTPFIQANWLILIPFIILMAYGVRILWRHHRRQHTDT
jgi:hypothetical protein